MQSSDRRDLREAHHNVRELHSHHRLGRSHRALEVMELIAPLWGKELPAVPCSHAGPSLSFVPGGGTSRVAIWDKFLPWFKDPQDILNHRHQGWCKPGLASSEFSVCVGPCLRSRHHRGSQAVRRDRTFIYPQYLSHCTGTICRSGFSKTRFSFLSPGTLQSQSCNPIR